MEDNKDVAKKYKPIIKIGWSLTIGDKEYADHVTTPDLVFSDIEDPVEVRKQIRYWLKTHNEMLLHFQILAAQKIITGGDETYDYGQSMGNNGIQKDPFLSNSKK